MAGGMGSFIAGIEDLFLVERLSARCNLSPRTLVRIGAVILAVGIVLIVVVSAVKGEWFAGNTLELESGSVLGQTSTEFDNEPSAVQAPAAVAAPSVVVVYVTGAVANPGLYSLPADKRIGDAVQAAGGFLPEAATAVVNLAQQLTDGMQIHILTTDEVHNNAPGAGTASPATGPPTVTADNSASALVNINTADAPTLQTLDGIGPATAQKIIDYRSAHGPFQSKEELKNVSGIGEKKYTAIQAKITV